MSIKDIFFRGITPRDMKSERGITFDGFYGRVRDMNREGVPSYEDVEPHSAVEVGVKFSF